MAKKKRANGEGTIRKRSAGLHKTQVEALRKRDEAKPNLGAGLDYSQVAPRMQREAMRRFGERFSSAL